ncbi:MAG: LamG domain-containing protein [Nanoarchaeota archaeon]
MKNWVWIVLILLVVVLSVYVFLFNFEKKSTGNVISNPGLLLYYTFEGNLKDYSGNSLDLINEQELIFDSGVIGQSIRLEGNEALILPYIDKLNTPDDLSVSLWVKKQESAYPNPVFVSKRYWQNSGWFFGVNEKTNVPVFQISDGTKYLAVPFGVAIRNNEWYHLAFVLNKGKFKAYINGQLVREDSKTLPPQIIPNLKPILIGKNQENDNNYFNGLMDEVKIYNRPLSDQEINKIFQNSNVNSTGTIEKPKITQKYTTLDSNQKKSFFGSLFG